VIFDEGTDIYWARSRVLEYLSTAARNLPQGVTPSLGPDATGVGWIYEYAVMAARRTLAELRSTQDWQVRLALANAEGVAEIASVGDFVRQYAVGAGEPPRLSVPTAGRNLALAVKLGDAAAFVRCQLHARHILEQYWCTALRLERRRSPHRRASHV